MSETFVLTQMGVEVSCYDEPASEEVVQAHLDAASSIVSSHLLAAKAELARIGVNVRWAEEIAL